MVKLEILKNNACNGWLTRCKRLATKPFRLLLQRKRYVQPAGQRKEELMDTRHLLYGFLFSTLGGAIVIWLLIEKWAWPYVRKHHNLSITNKGHTLTVWIGIVERALFTSSVLMGSAAFIPLWIAIKVAPQWERWKGDERVMYNVFLLGNALSVIFGLVGAWIAWGLPNNPLW